jgi:hypothetical protein
MRLAKPGEENRVEKILLYHQVVGIKREVDQRNSRDKLTLTLTGGTTVSIESDRLNLRVDDSPES